MKTPAQAQQAYQDSIPRATTNFVAGVQGYSGDWAAKTKAQRAVMLQNLTTAINSGAWDAGIDRVGTGGWKTRTEAKSANYGVGLNAGASRFNAAIAKILQAEANIVSGLPPRGDFNANVQRSVQMQTQLHALRGQLGAT
jgi:hypothetical protein